MSKKGNIVVRDNSGANTGTRRRLNFIDGANVTITTADSGVNDEVTVTVAAAAAGGTILANHNGGAPVGPARPEISFIDGANVTIVVADDAVNNEIDVTISAVGAGGGAWLKEFYPAEDPNDNIGTFNSVRMQDDERVTIRQNFMIPDDIVTLSTAVVIVISEGTGNIYRSVITNFGTPCIGETYTTHTDSLALAQVGIIVNQLDCIDISGALTGAVGGDLVGMEFTRDAINALDTVDADVHYIGIYIEGSTEEE